MSQEAINLRRWRASGAREVRAYARAALRPVELAILERHAGALAGRVLEVGVGAGRLTERLLALAAEVHGIDVSPAMVEHCRRTLPAARIEIGDLRDLSRYSDGSFGALVAGFNVIDVLGDRERRAALDEWRRVLVPGALLVMSSHNRAYAARIASPWRVRLGDPRRAAADLVRLPRRVANRRRLRPHERHLADYALVNDEAHDYALLHYYVGRREQEAQLAAHGFQTLECLDLAGRVLAPGEPAAACPELHYVARRQGG